ncbi:PREDICTED: uncharacterized protein LOC107091157 [Cyprinodon variegatus]|uniref:Uncharacterized LOC107091157 n=1 Tax=Cyprinodon variegatus TaxID=28743 RepID=A0A3Q2DP11_CYPVA|nr:PREDICTED: uncharacterized protein LOC107091157 [Cyprinodon variegatus]
MKFTGGFQSSCLALLLILSSASAVQVLQNINDLKKLNFGSTVPKHSLLLLHWFANEVNIDNNNIISLTFNPDQGDYGSHHYGNYERMLDQLPLGNIRYRYFTVGNLNQEASSDLPPYVVHPRIEYEGRNRDRIIFRVREQNVGRQVRNVIDRVYITQHFETSDNQGTRYDPVNTYQVASRLLRQIRQFSVNENDLNTLTNLRDQFRSNADYSQLRMIRNSWGDLACLGLFLFIVIQEKYSSNQQPDNRRQPSTKRKTQPDYVVNIPEVRPNRHSEVSIRIPQIQCDDITLKVVTGSGGKARIIWKKAPVDDYRGGMMIALYSNNVGEEPLTYKSTGNARSGFYDTSVLLNEGLQVRLHERTKLCCFWSRLGEEINRGPEFKNSTAAVSITGYKASLQLFVKDGKACARLYVKTSFIDWMLKFKDSWVGFYSSEDKGTRNYEWWQWQWAQKFDRADLRDCPDSFVFEYHSSMKIAPGVQARFIFNGDVEKARTPCWKE